MAEKKKQLSQKQKQLQRHSAGDAAKTKAPYDPLGSSVEFATEIADGNRHDVKVSVNPPQYVGRGGMKVNRSKSATKPTPH